MAVVVTILFVVIAVAVVAFALNAVRSAGETAERALDASSPVPATPHPLVADFHVKGDTAHAVFNVPLGDAEAGEHLVDLLCSAAVEYVRSRQRDGLPLDGVHRIEVAAMRGETPEVIGSVELPEEGVLPGPTVSVPVELEHDPIAAVAEVVADTSVAPASKATAELEPVGEFVQLSGPLEARLRSIGIDPAVMGLEELTLGLLRLSGYDVHVGRAGFALGSAKSASMYGLTRNGKKTVLAIVEHEPGTHPELGERVISEFAVGCAQVNPDQGLLVTDKYSPYVMYEREKRDKRLVFITRERLQAFVDSFGIV